MALLKEIVLEAAKKAGLAFSGTCSAQGTTSTLIDAVLRDFGTTTRYAEGSWVKRPNAVLAADVIRRINEDGFTVASGTLAPLRAWTNLPINAEAYEVYAVIPPAAQAGAPYDWVQAVNEGLGKMYYLDRLVLGHGTGRFKDVYSLTRTASTMIAIVAVAGGSAVTITPPSGWTLILRENNGTDIALAAYRKRVLKTDPIEFEWTFDTSRAASVLIIPLIDTNPTSPVDDSGATSGASSTTVTSPGVSATDEDDLVLRIFAAVGTVAMTPPDDLTEIEDVVDFDGAATMGIMAAYTTDSDSASDATGSQAAINIGMTIAIKPFDDDTQIAVGAARVGQNGSGDTKVSALRPANLPNDDWFPREDSVRRIWLRTYEDDDSGRYTDEDADLNSRYTERWTEDGQLRVKVWPAPDEDQIVVAEIERPYPALVVDDDETACPFEWAWMAAKWKAFEELSKTPASVGKYKAEAAAAFQDWLDVYKPPSPFVRF